MEENPSRSRLSARWLYPLFGLLVLALIVWSSQRVLRETPSRQVGVEIPGQGYVQLVLFADPFPPRAGAMTELRLFPESERGVPLGLGPELPFQVSLGGDAVAGLEGVFVENPAGNGYLAAVPFPAPGEYRLAITISPEAAASFTLQVEANP